MLLFRRSFILVTHANPAYNVAMKHERDKLGFSHIALFLMVIVLAGIGTVGWHVLSKNKNISSQSTVTQAAVNKVVKDKDQPAPLKNLGFNLDYYDPKTQRAGDFHFTRELASVLSGDPIYQKLIWSDYGIQDIRSPNDPTKRNVQPTFILPLGTKVLAPIDGIITKVETLYSNDWTIWFAKSSGSSWSYETEHVAEPSVKVGDKVTAGQVVAQVSPHGSQGHPGFGILEIGLFHPLNNQPTHWCPFEHFDSSVKDDLNKKITALYAAWEEYLGDTSIYNNESYPIPGCATLEPSAG